MKPTVKNKLVLGAALSAAFASTRFENAFAVSLLPPNVATQGEILTTNSTSASTNAVRSPRETGAEPIFPLFENSPENFLTFGGAQRSGTCPTGDCPTGTCPFARRADVVPNDVPPDASNVAIRSVARVYNSYRETLPASGTAAGTMRRDVVEKGSGAFIADSTGTICVLTAAHIFRDGRGTISVETVDGRDFSATLAFASDEYDVALLRVDDENADVPTLSVSPSWPKQGERVWRAGFGPNETLKTSTGVVEGYVKTSRNDSYETLKISGAARQGDSGGPICNASGEIVGVLWGTDGSDVYATYCARILKTLGEYSVAFRPTPDVESSNANPPFGAEKPIDSQLVKTFADVPSAPSDIPGVPDVPDVASLDALPQRSTVREKRDAARSTVQAAVVAARRGRESVQTTFQDWTRVFWNCALAFAFVFAVGYCGSLTTKRA